jgi:hypothetical protein
MIERPVRDVKNLREIGIALHDPTEGSRDLIGGLLFGMGARKIYNLNTTREMNELPVSIDIAVVLTNVGSSDFAGEVARSVRRGQLNIGPGVPMIAYATQPTIGLLKVCLGEWGFDEFLAVPITARALYAKLQMSLRRPRPMIVERHYIGPNNSKALLALDEWIKVPHNESNSA